MLSGPIKTKVIGKIYKEQMYKKDKWILPRISPKCENCNNNEYYTITCSTVTCIILSSIIKGDKVYKIICPNCGETIELEFDEYLTIEPLIKINKKYKEGKIRKIQYDRSVDDILSKIKII